MRDVVVTTTRDLPMSNPKGDETDDGFPSALYGDGLLWPLLCLCPRLRNVVRRKMFFDYALSGVVTAGLTLYLIYALVRPERF